MCKIGISKPKYAICLVSEKIPMVVLILSNILYKGVGWFVYSRLYPDAPKIYTWYTQDNTMINLRK